MINISVWSAMSKNGLNRRIPATLLVVLFSIMPVLLKSECGEFENYIEPGLYKYTAVYETGHKNGSQTTGHSFRLEIIEGDYYLNWGSLRVKADRIDNALCYRWSFGDRSGEGVYAFYEDSRTMFGSFLNHDAKGTHSGYTSGKRAD